MHSWESVFSCFNTKMVATCVHTMTTQTSNHWEPMLWCAVAQGYCTVWRLVQPNLWKESIVCFTHNHNFKFGLLALGLEAYYHNQPPPTTTNHSQPPPYLRGKMLVCFGIRILHWWHSTLRTFNSKPFLCAMNGPVIGSCCPVPWAPAVCWTHPFSACIWPSSACIWPVRQSGIVAGL